MLLRTPPGKQKRNAPVVTKINQVQIAGAVVEARPTSSPSKKPRLPFGIDVEEPDEPFSLRSLRRGSPWENAQPLALRQEQVLDELPPNAFRGQHGFFDSEVEDEDERELDWDSLRCSYKCRNLVKSDVLISLDSREKEVVELKAKMDSLRASCSTAEEEKKMLKKRVDALEQNLAAAIEREKAWHRQRTQESSKTEELIKTHLNRCGELESLLQEEMRKHGETQAKVLELEARASAAEDAKERAAQTAQREILRLREDLERLQDDSLFAIGRVNAEVEAERLRVHSAAAEAERLQSELKEMKSNIDDNMVEKMKLEHQLIDVQIHNSTRITGPSEADLVIKHLKEELSQHEVEIREARKLKRFHANVDLLKERLESEKLRAERAEAALSNLSDLEWKVKDVENELSAWKDMTTKLPGVESRSDIPLRFAELQREVVAAVAKTGEAQAQIVKLQTAVDMAEVAKHQAEVNASAAQAEAVEAVLNFKRSERKVALISKERDGLKAIISSYDEEEAVMASHQKKNPTAGLANLGTPEKAKDLRIQRLETALADAQQHAKLLSEELERGNLCTTEQRHRAETLALQLAQEQEKLKAVEREADQLRSEVSILEAKMGRGEVNTTTTKILHMLINPEVEAHGQSEVQALRARLELHERHFDGRREESTVTDTSYDEEKVALLKQRVTALEKREARYKQVFANKISVFREACGLIFGYKVQMNEEQDSSTGSSITLFTLRSIYSPSEEEQIQFQFKAGNLEMIANEYTSSPELQRQVLYTKPGHFDSFSSMVNTFLKNFRSIPAFIANLTMELFNKTTLG